MSGRWREEYEYYEVDCGEEKRRRVVSVEDRSGFVVGLVICLVLPLLVVLGRC